MMEESLAVEQLLCCKQSIYVRRKTKQAGKQAASLRHLANGLLTANISGVESGALQQPAGRRLDFRQLQTGEKAQPA